MDRLVGPHHESTAARLLRWLEVGNCPDFWLRFYTFFFLRLLACPRLGGERHLEAEEIRHFFFYAFGPGGPGSYTPRFFFYVWRGISAKWGINRPKTLRYHSRQHKKTKVSELYLSDCHYANFGDEMLRFAVFVKHFWVSPRFGHPPSQNTIFSIFFISF